MSLTVPLVSFVPILMYTSGTCVLLTSVCCPLGDSIDMCILLTTVCYPLRLHYRIDVCYRHLFTVVDLQCMLPSEKPD